MDVFHSVCVCVCVLPHFPDDRVELQNVLIMRYSDDNLKVDVVLLIHCLPLLLLLESNTVFLLLVYTAFTVKCIIMSLITEHDDHLHSNIGTVKCV